MSSPFQIITSITRFAPASPDDGPASLIEAARAAEATGYDNMLIGYSSAIPDGWGLAAYALASTDRIKVLLAHRPGVMAPTSAARSAATLDALSGGRLTLNIVTGGNPEDQHREGDYLSHDARYRRSAEYVELMRRVWAASEPLNFTGEFYRVEGTSQRLRPRADASPTIYMGGASPAAAAFAAAQADVYMHWSEPVIQVKGRFDDIRRRSLLAGRPEPNCTVSLRLIIRETEQEAWEFAESLLPADFHQTRRTDLHAEDVGRNLQLALTRESLVHDERLWLGLSAATQGQGGMGALVGTEDQVLEAILRYVREAGATGVLVTPHDGYFGPLPKGFLERLRAEGERAVAAWRAD